MKFTASSLTGVLIILMSLGFQNINAQQPLLAWATNAGGTGTDNGTALSIDEEGNVYTTGYYTGTVDFDPGPAVVQLPGHGGVDIFITKTDPNGNLVWARGIGGSGGDAAFSIKVTRSGYVYVTGYFCSVVDFDPGPGIDTMRNADDPCNTELFVLKLDSAGNYQWAKAIRSVVQICTDVTDVGYALDTDQDDNVYVTGYFRGTADFDPSVSSAYTLTASGTNLVGDIYILKLNAAGGFCWVNRIGEPLSDAGYALHVSDSGFVYVCGLYGAPTDFDPGAGTDTLPAFGNWDMFILKLDSAGNHIWAKGIGGSTDDRAFGITSDTHGNVLVTGFYSSTVDFNPGPAVNNLASNPSSNSVFILKLDPAGNYIWAKGIVGAGGGEISGTSIVTNRNGEIFTTGYFSGTADFDVSTLPADTFMFTAPGVWWATDSYVAKYDSLGNFIWAFQIGGANVDRGKGITVDTAGNIWSTGYFGSGNVDFDPTTGTFIQAGSGTSNVYVQKIYEGLASGAITFQSEPHLLLYPNPGETHSLFTIETAPENKIDRVRISDATGRLISDVDLSSETVYHFYVSDPGVYFMSVIGADGSIKTYSLIVR